MGDVVYAVLIFIGLTSAQEITISNRPLSTNETAAINSLHQKNVVILPQTQFSTTPYENTNPQFINSQSIPNPQIGQVAPLGTFQPLGNYGTSPNFFPFFPNNVGQANHDQSLALQPPQVQIKEVRVPQPYPVYVSKPVPVHVQVRVPVEVPKPYPVKVPHPVPVPVKINVPFPVEKPYPVTITRTVVVPIDKPVYIRVPDIIREPVAHPYQIRFEDEETSNFAQLNSTQFTVSQELDNRSRTETDKQEFSGGKTADSFSQVNLNKINSLAGISQQEQIYEQQSALSSRSQNVDTSSQTNIGIPQDASSVPKLDQSNNLAGISQQGQINEQLSTSVSPSGRTVDSFIQANIPQPNLVEISQQGQIDAQQSVSLSLGGQISTENFDGNGQVNLGIPQSTSNEIPESSSKPTDYANFFTQYKEV